MIGLFPALPATLERLSMVEMIAKSTSIVRGQVTGASTAFRDSVIYTHYRVHVTDRWKGPAESTVDVQVPGGVANGIRQSFAGAPELIPGEEYVLFLWTSSKGITYTIGFTQGVFHLPKAGPGRIVAERSPTSESMLDHEGRPVKDEAIRMPLAKLVETIRTGAAR